MIPSKIINIKCELRKPMAIFNWFARGSPTQKGYSEQRKPTSLTLTSFTHKLIHPTQN